MFVFKLGKVVGVFLVIMGLYGITAGALVSVLADDLESIEFASRRYLGTNTPGQAIDRGLFRYLVMGLPIWMIAEIGQRLTPQPDDA